MLEKLFLLACVIMPRPSYMNPDNLALLTGTLKTMQRAACDDEMVSLACPRGTSISIQVAQYGKAASEGHNCALEGSSLVDVEIVDEENCLWPNSMQYSLLQTVVEACQKKPQCKFSTKSKPGSIDPCPLARKFVEVAYKCRPYEFRSRTGCENDIITVSCNPHSRIAVFDAQYGRTAYESTKCPQAEGIPDETCTVPFAVETVMEICHGKRRCQINVNYKTFGSPCKLDSRPYLKIVYACVPLGVLTEKYESATEKDEIMNFHSEYHQEENLFEENDEFAEKKSETNGARPITNLVTVPQVLNITHSHQPAIDVTIIENTKKNTDQNETNTSIFSNKMLIYVSASILICILLMLLIVAIRYFVKRRSTNNSKTNDIFITETPNIFGDGLSDIDNDVDISHISGTFYDPVHPDMILYKDIPGNSTLRAMRPLSTVYPCVGTSMYGNVDYAPSQSRDFATNRFNENKPIDKDVIVSPKSLRGYSSSQFFYG